MTAVGSYDLDTISTEPIPKEPQDSRHGDTGLGFVEVCAALTDGLGTVYVDDQKWSVAVWPRKRALGRELAQCSDARFVNE